jgi:hypothetical protein
MTTAGHLWSLTAASGCRSQNGSELERTAANWRGSFRFITHYAVGQKSVLSGHPAVGNLGG